MEELLVLKDFYKKEELEGWIMKPKGNILLVATEDDEVIGFIYAKVISPRWCMLESLGVEDKHRGKGIGTKLLENLYAILKEKGVDYIQALVGEEHNKSHEFWKRKGFVEGKKFIWIEKYL